MIPIRDLFEAHLTVTDLQRSMSFFRDSNSPSSSLRGRARSTGQGVEVIPCWACGKQVPGHNECGCTSPSALILTAYCKLQR
jgi:hypothetical protein